MNAGVMLGRRRIRRRLSREWTSELERAVSQLPESELCSRELLGLVCTTPGPKLIALAVDSDGPVAVVPFLGSRHRRDPLLQWILPATLGLSRDGDPFSAFPRWAVSHVGWWRQERPPPRSLSVHNVSHARSHGMPLDADPIEHWKSSGHWNTVRQSRKKSAQLEFRVNAPDMAEWTIRNWARHWNATAGGAFPELEYRVVVARHLETKGLHFTLTLHDGEKPVAGHTFVRHGDAVVWQVTYRDVEYDRLGVGTRLMDAAFDWAKTTGAARIDLGGLQAYKARWAPESGDRYEFDFCHPGIQILRSRARRTWTRLRH